MATVVLEYNDRNSTAKQVIEGLIASGIFSVKNSDETKNLSRTEQSGELFAETFGMWADRDIDIKEIRRKNREKRTKSYINDTL